jgi:hypothetical protein
MFSGEQHLPCSRRPELKSIAAIHCEHSISQFRDNPNGLMKGVFTKKGQQDVSGWINPEVRTLQESAA